MTVLLVGLGGVALVLPGLRPSLSLRGNPRWFAPLDAIALALGAAAVLAGLTLSAAVGVLHLVTGTALARYDGHLAPGGLAASIASAIVLAIVGRNLARAAGRARRATGVARAEAWVGRHHAFGDHEVVVLPTSELVAYSVDGSPPQVVVSEGFEAQVGADMAAFVIDHERAHLRRRHRRLLVVSALVDATFGFVPMVRRSALALMLAVERAADEAAAGPDRQRRHRLAAAMRDLAATGSRSMPVEAVTYRAAGLASPPPRASRPELLAVAGLVALGLAVVGTALHIGIEAPAVVACLR